jgi:LmbE family N-acetylglucosaminyl deacetylase
MRRTLRHLLVRQIERRSARYPESRLPAPLVVVAPHPDDEVLGCGELVRRKRAAGAPVRIVIVSDGSASHRRFIGAETLRMLRAQEALEAAARLGVGPEDVIRLDLPDGRLGEHVGEAAAALERIFQEYRPREVAFPHRWERTPDHVATWEATRRAVRGLRGVTLLEYGIWIWRVWPIVPLQGSRFLSQARNLAGEAVPALHLARAFNVRLAVERPDLKRHALAAHRTQVERPAEWPDWPVLSDVDGGLWLEALLGSAEYYRQTEVGEDRQPAAPVHRDSVAAGV